MDLTEYEKKQIEALEAHIQACVKSILGENRAKYLLFFVLHANGCSFSISDLPGRDRKTVIRLLEYLLERAHSVTIL